MCAFSSFNTIYSLNMTTSCHCATQMNFATIKCIFHCLPCTTQRNSLSYLLCVCVCVLHSSRSDRFNIKLLAIHFSRLHVIVPINLMKCGSVNATIHPFFNLIFEKVLHILFECLCLLLTFMNWIYICAIFQRQNAHSIIMGKDVSVLTVLNSIAKKTETIKNKIHIFNKAGKIFSLQNDKTKIVK